MLKADSVSYQYGKRQVISGVSLEIRNGVTALLGPNGAGKSTLLEVLVRLRRPTTGTVESGQRAASHGAARCVGYLPQRFSLAHFRTAAENVAFAAWVHGLDREACWPAAVRALERVDLRDEADTRVRRLSGGQRQRVGIACAIAHDPGVVVFDEPTVGLDPKQRRIVSKYVTSIGETSAVLMSTHLVEDVQRMASSAIVMSGGRIVFDGSVEQLAAMSSNGEASMAEKLDEGYATLLDGV